MMFQVCYGCIPAPREECTHGHALSVRKCILCGSEFIGGCASGDFELKPRTAVPLEPAQVDADVSDLLWIHDAEPPGGGLVRTDATDPLAGSIAFSPRDADSFVRQHNAQIRKAAALRSRPAVVDAEVSDRPRASTECPICGIGEPHAHDGVAIESWLSNMVSRWGFKARVSPLEAQSRMPDRDAEPEKSDAALFYEDAATKNGGKT